MDLKQTDDVGMAEVETEEDLDQSLSNITFSLINKDTSDSELEDISEAVESFVRDDEAYTQSLINDNSNHQYQNTDDLQQNLQGFDIEGRVVWEGGGVGGGQADQETSGEVGEAGRQNGGEFGEENEEINMAPELPLDDDMSHHDEPEDIEIEYDDKVEMSAGSSHHSLVKKCDVLLPNFTYQEEHKNKAGRFPLGKLAQTHPEFFNNKKKRKKNEFFVSKSMGGGFTAKSTPPPAAAKDKAKNNRKKTAVKEVFKTGGGRKDDSNKKKQQQPDEIEVPQLTEVTIRDLQVNMEKLHKNIVSFKYKQYQDFLEYMQKKKDGAEGAAQEEKPKKQAKAKGKAAAAAPTKASEAKSKGKKTEDANSKNVSGPEKSRLMDKYKKFLESSDSSDDEGENKAVTSDNNKDSTKYKKKQQDEVSTESTPIKKAAKSDKRTSSVDSSQSNKNGGSTSVKAKSRSRSRTCSVDSVSKEKKIKSGREASSEVTDAHEEANSEAGDDIQQENGLESPDSGSQENKAVLTNPFFNSTVEPEDKKVEEESKDTREKEKEKLVEMLFSLIKGSKNLSEAQVKSEVVETDTKSEKETPVNKPAATELSSFDQLLSGGSNQNKAVSDSSKEKKNDDDEKTAKSQDGDTSVLADDDEGDNFDNFDNTCHDDPEEDTVSEKQTIAEETATKSVKEWIHKSDATTRSKSLPSGLYESDNQFKDLYTILQLHLCQRSLKPRTVGDLEDALEAAIHNLRLDVDCDLKARNSSDNKVLKDQGMRTVRVNLSHVHKDPKYVEAYLSGVKKYDVNSMRDSIALYWSVDKKIEHVTKCLQLAKSKVTRKSLVDSDTDDDRPSKETLSSPSYPEKRKRALIDSDSDDGDRQSSPLRDRHSSVSPVRSESHSRDRQEPGKHDSSRKHDNSSKHSSSKHDNSSKQSSRKHDDKHKSAEVRRHREPEIQRSRDENKRPRDPNKFVIPKKHKSSNEPHHRPHTMKSILEEGLRKGAPVKQHQHQQHAHRQQNKYQDWRKERKIKEAKKIVDLKKIEVNTPSGPNLDSILTSMDKITKKVEKKEPTQDGGNKPVPSSDKNKKPEEKTKKSLGHGETDTVEKKQGEEEVQLEDREQERLRQQRARQQEVSFAAERQDSSTDDLVSDHWGDPVHAAASSTATSNRVNRMLPSMVKPNIRANLAEPGKSKAEEGALGNGAGDGDDDFDDEFDLPVPVSAVHTGDDGGGGVDGGPPPDGPPEDDDGGDDFCDNDDGGGDFHDGYDDQDETTATTVLDSKNMKGDLDSHEKQEQVKKLQDRSRTPSPFLRTNRYYPEFYAKKAETAKEEKLAAQKPKTEHVNNPADKSNTQEKKSFGDEVVNATQAESSPKEELVSKKIKEVNLPSDIDERIAKFFKDRRSKKEKKRKSKFKDFEIDPNHSFLDAARDANDDSLGSRLAGDGLGLFINKVISSLKVKSSPQISQAESSPVPSEPLPAPPPMRGGVPPPPPPRQDSAPSPLSDTAPVPPPVVAPVPPPARCSILSAPVPPPPPPLSDASASKSQDLEPGELPKSPLVSQSTEDEDEGSTINVKETDIDDDMILEIVAELDDTLEEEEKLSKAKEKLAKRLLKKKAMQFQKWETEKQAEIQQSPVNRSQSVRKRMLGQLPQQPAAEPEISDEARIHPTPPSGFLPSHLPPPRPPSALHPRTALLGVPPPSSLSSHPNAFSPSSRLPLSRQDEPLSRFQAGNIRSPAFEAPAQEEVDSFVSSWGVDVAEGPADSEDNRYDSALSKLRGQRSQVPSMTSALEKLRNFSKRSVAEDADNFGQKRFRPNYSFEDSSDDFYNGDRYPSYGGEAIDNEQKDINSTWNSRRIAHENHGHFKEANDLQQWRRPDNNHYRDQNNQNEMFNSLHRDQPDWHRRPQPAWQTGAGDYNSDGGGDSVWKLNGSGPVPSWQRSGQQSLQQPGWNRHQPDAGGGSQAAGRRQFELEEAEDDEEEEEEDEVDDDQLYATLLRLKITTESERNFLSRMIGPWKQVVNNQYEHFAGVFTRLVADRKSEAERDITSSDLGSLFNDYRLNMRVVDKEGGEEKRVFTSSEKSGTMEFKCEVCSIFVLGKKNIESHLMGKKHLGKLEGFTIVAGSTDPVVRKKKSLVSIHEMSVISQLLPSFTAAPLVGLEYVVEVWRDQVRDPRYHCLLCRFRSGIIELMYHLLSAQHRLNYLEKFFPEVHAKFSRVQNRRFWELPTYDTLDYVVGRIEYAFGRKNTMVTDDGEKFSRDNSAFLKAADSVEYHSEVGALNLHAIKDPFAMYAHRIPRHQLSS